MWVAPYILTFAYSQQQLSSHGTRVLKAPSKRHLATPPVFTATYFAQAPVVEARMSSGLRWHKLACRQRRLSGQFYYPTRPQQTSGAESRSRHYGGTPSRTRYARLCTGGPRIFGYVGEPKSLDHWWVVFQSANPSNFTTSPRSS